jgi:Zn-finger nucleic acid-binding protein
MEGENLQEVVKKQTETMRLLEARTVELEAIIIHPQKNPRNSSTPPSLDIVKSKPTVQKINDSKKRKICGQKAHRRHECQPFPIEATLDVCPKCGGVLHACDEIVMKQRLEAVCQRRQMKQEVVWAERHNKMIYQDGDRVIKLMLEEHPGPDTCNEAITDGRW